MEMDEMSMGVYDVLKGSDPVGTLYVFEDHARFERPQKGKVKLKKSPDLVEKLASGELSDEEMNTLLQDSTPSCDCSSCDKGSCEYKNEE